TPQEAGNIVRTVLRQSRFRINPDNKERILAEAGMTEKEIQAAAAETVENAEQVFSSLDNGSWALLIWDGANAVMINSTLDIIGYKPGISKDAIETTARRTAEIIWNDQA
ncbi:MAG: hypothetical protein ONB12_12470, partial [candidate division KSB1 bacterium]|nr:hypothetical protein [candidate division KSB1 bacterium]